jgi:DNA polymerase (family 10)
LKASLYMKNAEVADLLMQMSLLSEAAGEDRFKSIAYRRAATTIKELSEDIEKVWRENRLLDLPHVGEGIAKKIDEYLSTGEATFIDKLQAKVPEGALELMKLQGIGPRTAYKLAKQFGIKSLDELERELESGRLKEELGEQKSKKLLDEVKKSKTVERRMLLPEAESLAAEISNYMEQNRLKVFSTGSLRRGKSTVGDLDFVSTTAGAGDILMRFPGVESIIEHGPKRTSVKLSTGIQVDLRVFEPSQFGAAMMYFTGSKEHNITMRNLALSKKMKLNEYGLFDSSGKVIAGRSEEEVFSALGLQFIPPEMRENRGEVEAALVGKIPELVKIQEIKGDLQVHSTWSDGESDVKSMAMAAKALGYEYLGVTDHSLSMRVANGLSEERFRKQWKEIDSINEEMAPFKILKGVELEVRGDGTLDFDRKFLEEFEYVGASIHQGYRQSPDKLTHRAVSAISNPSVDILFHPTNRLIRRREGHQIDIPKLIKAARDNDKILEIDGQPDRLDLDEVWVRRAWEERVTLVIDSDAHSTEQLQFMRYGVLVGRRGWLTSRAVLNSQGLKGVLKRLKR